MGIKSIDTSFSSLRYPAVVKKESAILHVEYEMHYTYETRARKDKMTQLLACLTVDPGDMILIENTSEVNNRYCLINGLAWLSIQPRHREQ